MIHAGQRTLFPNPTTTIKQNDSASAFASSFAAGGASSALRTSGASASPFPFLGGGGIAAGPGQPLHWLDAAAHCAPEARPPLGAPTQPGGQARSAVQALDLDIVSESQSI